MKLYEKPDFAARMFEIEDVITVSGGEQPDSLKPADVVETTQWDAQWDIEKI